MIMIMVVIIVILPVVTWCPTVGRLIDLQEALEEIIYLRLIHVAFVFCLFCFDFTWFVWFSTDLPNQLKDCGLRLSSLTTCGRKQAALLAKTVIPAPAACVAFGISIDWVVGWAHLVGLGSALACRFSLFQSLFFHFVWFKSLSLLVVLIGLDWYLGRFLFFF